MRHLHQIKNRILLLTALGAWLGFAWGALTAAQEIAAHQLFQLGLWRLIFLYTQDVLYQTWQQAFSVLVPLSLLQIGFLARFNPRPVFTFLWTLPAMFWLTAWAQGYLKFGWLNFPRFTGQMVKGV